MKRVLLTGATGFIGRHCVKPLLEHGYEVHATSARVIHELNQGIHWQQTDLLDDRQVANLIARVRPTHLLHLAWFAKPQEYWTSLENFRWVQASLTLLKTFSENGGERVVMAGTCAEYDWQNGNCLREDSPPRPASVYGVCKHALHLMLEAFANQVGLSAAWGRIFYLYGPFEPSQRLVPSIALSLFRDEPALCTHGNQVRDFLHVEDVASAFVSLLDSDVRGPVNIASGDPVALKEIIHIIADILERKELVRLGARPAPANEPACLVADTRRLREEVHWSPQYRLRQGLEETVRWWREQTSNA